MKKLRGKLAFITGGNRGMGAAIAIRLAQEGAHVVITHSGKHPDKAATVLNRIREQEVQAAALIADNEHPNQLLQALEQALASFGRLDILVNNAGIFDVKEIADHSLEEYERFMNVNVKAVFVALQFAARHMQEGGSIITIGSNMAERVMDPGASLYAMSKSALIGLTKGVARDLGPRNITVNLLQPGPVDTDMNPAHADHAAQLIQRLAIRRYGKPEEIAGMVAFLAGEESRFITGAALTMDGGYNI